jgi:uncharacterized damage-inducible protein DinB
MYRSIADFLQDWEEEAKMTVRLFKAVSDEGKGRRLNDQVRSLDRLAWHITQSITEMGSKAGIFKGDTLEHAPVPATMQDLIAVYKTRSMDLMKSLSEKWTDESLSQELNMYGQTWTKARLLQVLIRHQTHHRAQMTTLMRLLGMPVPGLYGPSKEDWARMGMPAHD